MQVKLLIENLQFLNIRCHFIRTDLYEFLALLLELNSFLALELYIYTHTHRYIKCVYIYTYRIPNYNQ